MDIPDRPLDPAYRLVVPGDPGPAGRVVDADDVLAFWRTHRAVTESEAQRRVHEVLLVGCLADTGELVGVSTAALHRSPSLRADVWYFRAFVAADHRMSNVAVQLLVQGHDVLQGRYADGDHRAIGTLIEVQHEGLRRSQPHAVWPQSGFAFIGENARGDHVRVHYYDGAEVPLPG